MFTVLASLVFGLLLAHVAYGEWDYGVYSPPDDSTRWGDTVGVGTAHAGAWVLEDGYGLWV